MARKTDIFEDDGRTIADMGDVRRPSLLLPRRDRDSRRELEEPAPSREFSDELQDSEERLMVLLGTLRAALSIGMVYIVVFGIAIGLMVLFWS